MDEEGCAGLPRVLLARGADVRAARDPDREDTPGRTGADRILTLRTPHRCEVVVMSGERIVSWHDASALETSERAALFAISALVERQSDLEDGPGSVRLDLTRAVPTPPADDEGLGLSAVERWQTGIALDALVGGDDSTLRPLDVAGDDAFVPSGQWQLSPILNDDLDDAEVLAILVDSLPAVERVPHPVPDASADRIDALVPQRNDKDLVVRLTITQRRSSVQVQADGLLTISGPMHRQRHRQVAWRRSTGAGGRATSRFSGTNGTGDDEPISWFTPALEATSDEVTARLGTVGGFRLLELDRVGQRTPERLRLDNQPGWSSVAVLNYTCELGADRLAIASYLDLDDVELATVGNAQLTSRRIGPVLKEVAEPQDGDPDPGDALRSLAAGLRGVAPHLDATAAPLDASLTQALSDRLDRVTGARHRRVHVGLEVSDVWLTPHGNVSFSYQRFHPGTSADAGASGTRAHTLWADRRRHLTEHPLRCRYCHTDVCESCEDGITACEICSERLCLACATSEEHPTLLMCDACRSLRPARRPGAISWPEAIKPAGAPLVGTDRHHRVVVAPSTNGGAWRRVVQPSGAAETAGIALAGAVLDHLNGLAAQLPDDTCFVAGSPVEDDARRVPPHSVDSRLNPAVEA